MSYKDKTINFRAADGVIFDLDGTLVDSMGIWKDIDVVFLGEHGYSVPQNLHMEIGGMSFTETAVYFKERFKIPWTVEQIKKCWNDMAYDKYLNEVPIKPGIEEFLPWVSSLGCRLAIASSNSHQLIEAVLNAHGIRNYFSAIVTSCDVSAGKPAPDVYLKAAELLGVDPEKCIVFEDIPEGIQAGKAAGMSVIAVEDAFSEPQRKIKLSLCDGWVSDYRELISKE